MIKGKAPRVYLPAVVEEEFFNKFRAQLKMIFNDAFLEDNRILYVHADAFSYGSFSAGILFDYIKD